MKILCHYIYFTEEHIILRNAIKLTNKLPKIISFKENLKKFRRQLKEFLLLIQCYSFVKAMNIYLFTKRFFMKTSH